MNWKNITSYAQGQKDRAPATVETRPSGYRIVVTRLHGLPGKWFLRCDAFDSRELKGQTLEDAQAEAISIVKAHLAAVLAELIEDAPAMEARSGETALAGSTGEAGDSAIGEAEVPK